MRCNKLLHVPLLRSVVAPPNVDNGYRIGRGGDMSDKKYRPRLKSLAASAVALLACVSACTISIPTRDSLPFDKPLPERVQIADQYCLKVGEKLDRRGALNNTRTGARLAIAVAGVATAISTGFFVAEARDDTSDPDKLTTRGSLALGSAVVTALATVVFAYAKDEVDARREGSREINKVHALAESTKIAIGEKQASEITQADKELPAQLVDSCYAIADKNEERGQKAIEAMISDAGARAADVIKRRNDAREKCDPKKAQEHPEDCAAALRELADVKVSVQKTDSDKPPVMIQVQ